MMLRMPITIDDVKAHLALQYDEWERKLYPSGRLHSRATLTVDLGDGTSGYDFKRDVIVIFVAEWNLDDFVSRLGHPFSGANRIMLPVNETELLHEMLHEQQFKDGPEISAAGHALYEKFKNYFSGQGHDEVFFTVIAAASGAFGMTPEQLVQNL